MEPGYQNQKAYLDRAMSRKRRFFEVGAQVHELVNPLRACATNNSHGTSKKEID